MSVTNPWKRGRGVDTIADWAAKKTANGKRKPAEPPVKVIGKSSKWPKTSADYWREDAMPKRYRKTSVSRRRGGGKRRATYSRGRTSAFRLKSAAGARGRRGLKRFRKRIGRKGVPTWFKTLCKGLAPSNIVGEYGMNIPINTIPASGNFYKNACTIATFWKHYGMWDTQVALDFATGVAGSNGLTNPSDNTIRTFLKSLTRRHVWRSALQGGEQELEFYQLIPRNNLPQAINVGGTANNGPQIAPNATADYKTGGAQLTPTMWSQPFSDENSAMTSGGSYANQKISATQNMVTPYMNPVLTSLFKIKKLKVSGPNGVSSLQRLQPGQECTFTGKFQGPKMISWNNIGLTGQSGNTAGAASFYEYMKGQTMIFMIARGTVSHSTQTKTNVVESAGSIDYYQTYKYELWQPTPVKKYTQYVTTGLPLTESAMQTEQVDIVNASDTVIVPE